MEYPIERGTPEPRKLRLFSEDQRAKTAAAVRANLEAERAKRPQPTRFELLKKKTGRFLGKSALVAAGVTATLAGIYELSRMGPTHEPVDSEAAMIAELGHMPQAIEAIKTTQDPDVREVDYKVSSKPQDEFVSAIAADLNPMAPDQDLGKQFDAIASYIKNPRDRANYIVRSDQEYHFLVNVKTGNILKVPRKQDGGSH